MTATPAMDDVERMYRHLVRTIRVNFNALLTQPFPVSDLYQTVLPYRLHRRELGLETNQDYEMALLALLSGARNYLVVDDRMRETLSAELASPNPNPMVIRDFASARIALAPEPLRLLQEEGSAPATTATVVAATTTVTGQPKGESGSTEILSASTPARDALSTPFRASVPAAPAIADAMDEPSNPARTEIIAAPTATGGETPVRRTTRPITVAAEGESCPFCKGELPAGRQIGFCPHCGQDLTVVHCPACGSELERGWKFCVTCGRSAGDL